MTRARHSLTLLQVEGGAPWIPGLHGDEFHRTTAAAAPSFTTPSVRYELLGLGDLWLSFAGRAARHEEACDAIAGLATGDPLRLVDGEKWLFLEDASGTRIGALSEAASTQWRDHLSQIVSVREPGRAADGQVVGWGNGAGACRSAASETARADGSAPGAGQSGTDPAAGAAGSCHNTPGPNHTAWLRDAIPESFRGRTAICAL